MIVQDIMTPDPTTVTETTGLGEAMGVLTEGNIRHLPVTRGGDVVGMLSDRDVASLGYRLANDVEHIDSLRARLSQPVSSMMSGGVVTVGQDADVSEVVELLLEEKLGAVPVVESGTTRLVGIVSYVDVLRAVGDVLDRI